MKSKKILLVVVLFVSSLFGFNNLQAQDNWIVIATKTVSYKADTDRISPSGKEQNVSKIKIKCTQGTLKLKKVHVEMKDGTKKSYNAKGTGVISKGMSSLSFDLPGKTNNLKHVELEYDSVGNVVVTKRAKIELLGKKASSKD